jgi:hypothetical protein
MPPMNTTLDAMVQFEGAMQADLAALADQIRERLHRHTSDMVAIGADLIAVKELLEHGQFGGWIEREFGMTARSAQMYMRAPEWAEGKSEIISHLPPAALRLLSAPTTPQPIQEEVLEAIRVGDEVDFKGVEARVKEQREELREEKKKEARRQRKSPAEQKRIERREEREAAAREEQARQRNLLVEEVAAILRGMPAADLARLHHLHFKLRYVTLSEILGLPGYEEVHNHRFPAAAIPEEPGR